MGAIHSHSNTRSTPVVVDGVVVAVVMVQRTVSWLPQAAASAAVVGSVVLVVLVDVPLQTPSGE